MSTSSTNMGRNQTRFLLLYRDDADASAVLAVVLEPDLAIDLREQRVVLAEADVQARIEAPTLLAHQNGTTGDEVAIVPLDAQPLGIAVAAVAGAALPFFMSHYLNLYLNI